MATIGQWRGGTVGSLVPTSSWAAPNGMFATQDRNDGSAYSFSSSTATLTLPSTDLADGYLIIAGMEFHSTHESVSGSFTRITIETKITQASGTGTFVGTPNSTFIRDDQQDRGIVQTWAFVDNPSASSTYQFQWRADSANLVSTDGPVWSIFTVIPLYYNDWATYTSTSANLYGGNTPNLVTGFSGTSGTNITISSDVVTLAGDNKRYLCLGAHNDLGRTGGRTVRWSAFEVDGVQEYAARGTTYYRDADSDNGGRAWSWLVETATANVTLEMICYCGDGVAAGEGGSIYDRSGPSSTEATMVILELPDSAEVYAATGPSTTEQDTVSTTPVDLNICDTEVVADSGSFTTDGDNDVQLNKADDFLFGFNVGQAYENVGVSDTERYQGRCELTLNGTEDQESGAGGFIRGYPDSDQGVFGCAHNSITLVEGSVNDLVGVSTTALTNTEALSQITSNVQLDWAGLWGINLDTLQAATRPEGRILQAEAGRWCWDGGNALLRGPRRYVRDYTLQAEAGSWAWGGGDASLDATVTSAGGTERLFPNAVVSSTGYTGTPAAGDLDDDPDSPDGVWWTTTNNTSTTAEVDMTAVTLGDADTATDALEVRAWVRKTNHSTDPTADLYIYRGTTLHATISTGTTITSTTGQMLSGTFTRGAFDATLSNLRVRITGSPGGGAPSNRASVEVGAIEVNADYTGAATTTSHVVLKADPGSWGWAGAAATLKPITQLAHHILVAGCGASWGWAGTNAGLTYTATGGTTTLTANAGSWTWTGAAAGLQWDQLLTAGAGAWSWTGAAAGLAYSPLLPAGAGAWSWSGAAAGLAYSPLLTAGAGAWSWAGANALLRSSRTVAAGAGAWSWAGADATFTLAIRMAADAGSWSWAGAQAGLTWNRTMAGGAGSWSWVGADAGFLYSRALQAGAGAWTWTGADAGLTYARALPAGAGSWSWTGANAGLTWDRLLAGGAGAWTWTGADAGLATGIRMVADAGAWSWAGAQAGLSWDRALAGGAGSWTWTGADAALLQNRLLGANAGAWTWTGADAGLSYGRAILAGAGAWTWAGADAGFRWDRNLVAGAGAWTWAGADAGLSLGTRMVADPGSWSWAGAAAGFRWDRNLVAGAGAWTWAGAQASLLYSPALQAASGAWSWTGAAAGLRWDRNLVAGAGTWAWAGADATLTLAGITTLVADPGAWSWTGADAGLRWDQLLQAELGAWTWTGAQAGLLWGRALIAGSGSWSWAGADATLTLAGITVLTADPGAWSWTGAQAGLRWDQVLPAGAGSWSWAGAQAALLYGRALIADPASWTWAGADAGLTYGGVTVLTADPGSWSWAGAQAGLTWDRALQAGAGSWSWAGADAATLWDRNLQAAAGSWSWVGADATFNIAGFLVVPLRNRVPGGYRARYVHALELDRFRPATHILSDTEAT